MKTTARRAIFFAAIFFSSVGILHAQSSVPAYSSQAGAPYTIYLDFSEFDFSGKWGGNSSPYTPGVQSAYGTGAGFSAATLSANIKDIWTGIATIYAPFHVNVTTVDPAVTAGFAATNYSGRQNYYDSQAGLMHTVVGGNGSWISGAGGVSYVGVTPYVVTGSNGYHTNFLFANEAPSNMTFITTGAAHENGHGFGLDHQTDLRADGSVRNEYSTGTGSGAGSVAPIMGVAYYSERGLWSIGTTHSGLSSTQNDAQVIANDPNSGGFVNDGIGHNPLSATALPLSGNTINFNLTQGVIVPTSSGNPTTTSYLADYWSFHTGGGTVSITANSGRESITAGVADPGGTLGSKLEILTAAGVPLFTSGTSTLSETLTVSLLAGSYIVEVLSAGQIVDPTSNNRQFFNMGPYFLSGTIPQALVPVPEPGTFALLSCGLFGLAAFSARRRRQSASCA